MPSPLRRKRQESDFRLIDVTKRTGICESRVSMLERDLAEPKHVEVLALSALFGAEPRQLFPRLRPDVARAVDTE